MHMTTTKDNSLWIDGDGRNISFVSKAIALGSIVMLTIGIFGTLFYGSHLVKDIQTNQTLSPPYTTISQVKDQNPLEFELIFSLVMLISLGVLIYEAISIFFNKPLDFYR